MQYVPFSRKAYGTDYIHVTNMVNVSVVALASQYYALLKCCFSPCDILGGLASDASAWMKIKCKREKYLKHWHHYCNAWLHRTFMLHVYMHVLCILECYKHHMHTSWNHTLYEGNYLVFCWNGSILSQLSIITHTCQTACDTVLFTDFGS